MFIRRRVGNECNDSSTRGLVDSPRVQSGTSLFPVVMTDTMVPCGSLLVVNRWLQFDVKLML